MNLIILSAIGYGIIFIVVFVWGLVKKTDSVDEINMMANKTANILFWGTVLMLAIFVIFFS